MKILKNDKKTRKESDSLKVNPIVTPSIFHLGNSGRIYFLKIFNDFISFRLHCNYHFL